jgi:hypothetical protein
VSFLNPHGSVRELLPRGVTPGGGGVILQFCRAILTTRSSPQNTPANNFEKIIRARISPRPFVRTKQAGLKSDRAIKHKKVGLV